MTPPAIRGLLVVSHIGESQVLYLMLDTDGMIHRLGDGTASGVGKDLFIGQVARDIFAPVCRIATPVLSRWQGEFSDPHPAGAHCQLAIGFRLEDGTEHVSYGDTAAIRRGRLPRSRISCERSYSPPSRGIGSN